MCGKVCLQCVWSTIIHSMLPLLSTVIHNYPLLSTFASRCLQVRVVVEVSSREQGMVLLAELRQAGYVVDSLSSNYSQAPLADAAAAGKS